MADPTLMLEILVDRPSGGAVVRDYMAADDRALEFYGGHFTRLGDYRAKAEEVMGGSIVRPGSARPRRSGHHPEATPTGSSGSSTKGGTW